MGNNEKENIKITLNNYLEGIKEINSKRIKTAFHPNARMYCSEFEDLYGKPAHEHFSNEWEQKAKNDPDSFVKKLKEKNILNIDINGNAASAKVETIFDTFKFTDYLNLIKVDTRWIIINKIWHKTLF